MYGKANATNEEVNDATVVSNALEFIQNKKISYDETAESLFKEMENQKQVITQMIGEDKYKEEIEVLKKMKDFEEKKGVFTHVDGDVDDRPEELKSFVLDTGFNSTCDSKGGNLSGG